MKPYFNVDQYLQEQTGETFHGMTGQNYLSADGGLQSGLIMSAADASQDVQRLAAQVGKAPAPYVINVANTTGGNLTAVLFGQSIYLLSTNYGSATGISVTSSSTNITYFQMLQQSAQQPYEVQFIRIQSSNSSQISQTLNITSVDSSGQLVSLPVFSNVYISPYQQQSGIVDINYPCTVDANTYFSFTVLANATATVTFWPKQKVNPTKLITGVPALTQYGAAPVQVASPVFMAMGANQNVIRG